MDDPRPLPLLGSAPAERSDAARNRERLLEAAQRLIRENGPEHLTMEALATAAGVGKGTVFRRFGSRAGLMAAVLDFSEAEWQASVISGPPPLGPGAPPWDRLVAFGRSRLERVLEAADLIWAADFTDARSATVHSFAALHVRHLLAELDTPGDLPLLAIALLAPLEQPVLHRQVTVEGIDVDRIHAAWVDLASRVVGR
ncbi:TetR family transcriptional regulator [Nocardioides sp. dk4132]|uniref:TetR/AcrR family transcriptional regulator n=1 Tax=unclassified Nocardioides TaxID=2615069 RepID=UPI0012955CB6|nr:MULTISPECIES: TetR/AcrR family transcriptional regulator [unclassified Nocardioides]MQW77746.1 TetR family transcriptional regulator [Nocardioides sp. dk4132]QGA07065.1 TetR family transcriptional regulator [Nocardioides sp. dk884]